MPTCKKCGYLNKEGNIYCTNCGSLIELTETEMKKIKAKEKTSVLRWLTYFLVFFGFSMMFGGLITWLTSIGTIIESMSFRVASPYIVIGLVLILLGIGIYYYSQTELRELNANL